MKLFLLLTLSVAVLLGLTCWTAPVESSKNVPSISPLELNPRVGKGDSLCIACVLLLSLVEQNALVTNRTPKDVIDTFCSSTSNFLGKTLCDILKFVLDIEGLDTLDPHISPEVVCEQKLLCPTPQTCTLFNTWPPHNISSIPHTHHYPPLKMRPSPAASMPRIPGGNFWDDFTQLIELLLANGGLKVNAEQVFDKHLPMADVDKDGDLHATDTDLRGTSWRGRDCDDTRSDVYPGRKTNNYASNASVDHNCNGIYGTAPSGVSYEELYCNNTGQMGIVIIGDSASAHFRLPPFLFRPSETFNDSNYDGTLHLLLNEADWPECSWATAYENQTNCPPNYAPEAITSVYQLMRSRNRCNHRDYANIGVNGARTSNVAPPSGTIMSYKRDQENDNPVLVFFCLIGNDVCNGHPGLEDMTTPTEFYKYVNQSLHYLDTQLPAGSHVMFCPLADGLLLHEILGNRTHPLGVTYPELYDYLICNGDSPCTGWMTSNDTLRNLTQQRADNLTAVYPQLMAAESFSHFDMDMLPAGMMEVFFKKWVAAGRDPAELIEPVDGFHPSTTANVLTATATWAYVLQKHPDWLGSVNPNNADIDKIFGNQGGY